MPPILPIFDDSRRTPKIIANLSRCLPTFPIATACGGCRRWGSRRRCCGRLFCGWGEDAEKWIGEAAMVGCIGDSASGVDEEEGMMLPRGEVCSIHLYEFAPQQHTTGTYGEGITAVTKLQAVWYVASSAAHWHTCHFSRVYHCTGHSAPPYEYYRGIIPIATVLPRCSRNRVEISPCCGPGWPCCSVAPFAFEFCLDGVRKIARRQIESCEVDANQEAEFKYNFEAWNE